MKDVASHQLLVSALYNEHYIKRELGSNPSSGGCGGHIFLGFYVGSLCVLWPPPIVQKHVIGGIRLNCQGVLCLSLYGSMDSS